MSSADDQSGAEFALHTPLADLPGVSKRRAQVLNRLDLHSVSDLLRYWPMRYEYESAEGAIDDLAVDTIGQVRGKVVGARYVGGGGGRGGKGRFEVVLADHSGRLHVVWFNAGYLRRQIHPSQQLRVQGKVKRYGGYPQMVNPRWELLDPGNAPGPPGEDAQTPTDGDAEAPMREDRYRPVYPATEQLPSRDIEGLIDQVLEPALKRVHDPLSAEYLSKRAMPALADAIRMAHRPASEDEAMSARRRLAYNELLLLQLGIAMKRSYVRAHQVAPALHHSQAIDTHIKERFPFELTQSQAQVIEQITGDLITTKPMNRLLQGDVGAGKTVVALYALLMAVADRRQGALMAPTQLLADQHYYSIHQMLTGSNVRTALLTGGQSTAGSAERQALLSQIANGEIDLVIGTQALIGESVRFNDLAVAVIDEQHRFGVMQRAGFRTGGGGGGGGGEQAHDEQGRQRVPHHLVMTATPIPRTLSLTVFGDLDVSTIRGLPPGRTPVINRVVGPEKADEVYAYLRKRVEQGEQAYVVVPIIDATGQESAKELKNVRAHAKFLQDKFGPSIRIAAMHGRLHRDTRETIMDRFRQGKIQVLVATTVIEVGVDVPNATVMVIEHAERFGLAQLHQLRGRIGRGVQKSKSLCVFIAEPTTPESGQRLEAIASTNDGFKIAEMDLEIRGMGEFFGTRQHGMPPLRVAKIPDDMDLLGLARRDAIAMIEADPTLSEASHELLRRLLMKEYGEALGLIDVG